MEFSTYFANNAQLSYNPGIITGVSWEDVFADLVNYIPTVKRSIENPDPFGIGLQLSTQVISELSNPSAFSTLRDFLNQNRCYLYTVKGFNTDLINWKDPKQLDYHNNLASSFVSLLLPQITGSVSTVPGAPKQFVNTESDILQITQHWVAHVEHLVRLERQTGKHIVLAVQPESMSFLENYQECADFFNTHVFSNKSRKLLSNQLNVGDDVAEDLLRTHITLSLEIVQASKEFGSLPAGSKAIESSGISIGKRYLAIDKLVDSNLESQTVSEINSVVDALAEQATWTEARRAA